jgi:hypothetical protein
VLKKRREHILQAVSLAFLKPETRHESCILRRALWYAFMNRERCEIMKPNLSFSRLETALYPLLGADLATGVGS